MNRAEEILAKLIDWANRDPNVRRLTLVGSRARAPAPDDLADIDLQVFADTHEPYTRDLDWLNRIDRVWVCVPDQYVDGDLLIPTRLVIFEGGVKVDFAFYPADAVSQGLREGRPHRVLLDRRGSPVLAPPLSDRMHAGVLLDAARFSSVVEEFWFEAYHVGKYLARGESWLASIRHAAVQQLLLRMIDWHERVVGGRRDAEPWGGERSRVSPETWEASQTTLTIGGRDESWRALLAAMNLFRRLAMEVATAAGLSYPTDVDRNLSTYVLGLRPTDGSDAPA